MSEPVSRCGWIRAMPVFSCEVDIIDARVDEEMECERGANAMGYWIDRRFKRCVARTDGAVTPFVEAGMKPMSQYQLLCYHRTVVVSILTKAERKTKPT